MMKIFLAVFLFAAYAQCSKLSDVLLDELIEKYEERRGADDLDPRFCGSTGLECERCSECHDHLQFGLCIKGATHARCLCKWGFTGANAERVPNAGVDNWSVNRIRADDCKTHCHYTHDVWNPECIGNCNYKNCAAQCGKCINDQCVNQCDPSNYEECVAGKCVPLCNEKDCASTCGKCIKGKCVHQCDPNKYEECVAGKCKPLCDEKDCASTCGKCIKGKCVHQCDPSNYEKCVAGKCVCDDNKCKLSGGECREGKCKLRCCRNLLTSVPPYSGGSFAKYCHDRCEYVELKPGACPPAHITPPCNPKCKSSGGICDKESGFCQCCKDFTGPHAIFTSKGLFATHCGVWCPHKRLDGSRNMLCVNPDYVARAEKKQNGPVISDSPLYFPVRNTNEFS